MSLAKKLFCLLLFLPFVCSVGFAQEDPPAPTWDSNYLEDQFYIGITYNFLLNQPADVNQQNLSYGLQTGFIKDIPLNSSRTVGLGFGLGYGVNSYYTNLRAVEVTDGVAYRVLTSNDSFKRNKLETHLIELPLEFRWRNSNATDFKFWRIYTGVKLGYVVGGRSKFISNQERSTFFTFNIHAYYGLNNLFDDAVVTTSGEPIGLRPLRIGIIFYIL